LRLKRISYKIMISNKIPDFKSTITIMQVTRFEWTFYLQIEYDLKYDILTNWEWFRKEYVWISSTTLNYNYDLQNWKFWFVWLNDICVFFQDLKTHDYLEEWNDLNTTTFWEDYDLQKSMIETIICCIKSTIFWKV